MNHTAPRLKQLTLLKEKVGDWEEYPFNIPIIKNLRSLSIKNQVCFFIGENGTGKSTLLEAIAQSYGFGKEGGSKNISFSTADEDKNTLSDYLRLSWSSKLLGGYFFRAESFFNVASFIDEIGKIDFRVYSAYGGESLHGKSHGESLLALFNNRFSRGGFYLMDEPEAALSPKRQMALLTIIYQILKQHPESQFIIATHSPILLAFPDAQIISFDGDKLTETIYEETEVYKITKDFLNHPKSFLNQLFEE